MVKSEFLVLMEIERSKTKLTQRELSRMLNLSLGTINKVVLNLSNNNLIKDMKITDEGYKALEPYRVKRAIFIAAGFGSRLVPITLNTPKPLVKVFGKRIIEYLLDAVVEVGIDEIYIVRGYLGEQFDVLLKKYPNIKLIDNDKYNEGNNVLSAMLVRDKFRNAYVFDADLVLSNKRIISKYQYSTNYLGCYTSKTDDWCLNVKGGKITGMQLGGLNCYTMYGVSYWTEEDGAQMEKDIEALVNMPGGKERYWDQAALEAFSNHYKIDIRPCEPGDIVEIDSFKELKQIDKTYDC